MIQIRSYDMLRIHWVINLNFMFLYDVPSITIFRMMMIIIKVVMTIIIKVVLFQKISVMRHLMVKLRDLWIH